MASSVTPADEQALDELQQSLLAARPRQLGQGEGNDAFRQHKLLASAIHSATRLHKFKQESETDAWIRYFESYFPRGRNDPQDGRMLFDDWRTSLLKDNTPGPRIPITHGQSHLHWQRDAGGRLCINLEDMWNDFEQSVARFIDELRGDPGRRAVVLRRWRERTWNIDEFVPTGTAWVGATVMEMNVSAAQSVSAISRPLPPPE